MWSNVYTLHLYVQVTTGCNSQNKRNTICTYKVALRRVRATNVAVEKECVTYSDCVSVDLVNLLAMRMHHFVICGPPRPTIFSTLSHERRDFLKKKMLLNIKKCDLIFSTTFVWNISHSKSNWARCDQKPLLALLWSTLYSCSTLMKLEFSRQVFEKYSDIQFHENPSIGIRVVSCGRTDRNDEAHSGFSKICESAKTLFYKS